MTPGICQEDALSESTTAASKAPPTILKAYRLLPSGHCIFNNGKGVLLLWIKLSASLCFATPKVLTQSLPVPHGNTPMTSSSARSPA